MVNKEIEKYIKDFTNILEIINDDNLYEKGLKLESIYSEKRNDNKTYFYVYTKNNRTQIFAKPCNGKARPQSIKTGLKYCIENNYRDYNKLKNPDNIYGKAIIKYIIDNILDNKLSIKDKIINSLAGKENIILKTIEIIDFVLEKYPNTNRTSIIPTDYCFNMKNKGSTKYELFEYINYSKLKYIGENKIKIIYPDDIQDEELYEGTKKQITVNIYERNPKAREECIKYYGTKCFICNFNFQKIYGKIGEGFIHVHHLKPLSEINEKYIINPIEDLRPVCPNCHAMLHKNIPAYSIETVKELLEK